MSIYEFQMNNFIEYVHGEAESICSGPDALHGIKMLMAAYQSAEEGDFVQL